MSSHQMVMYRDVSGHHPWRVTLLTEGLQDFRQYDVDKSGALSPDELKAVLSKQVRNATDCLTPLSMRVELCAAETRPL